MTHFKKIYGLTGGIATGKSTVANILSENGFQIVDADKIAHSILDRGTEAYLEVVAEFGEGILNEDLSINRKSLGDLVFQSREDLAKLNEITHSKVVEKIMEEVQNSSADLIILDIPLLIEEASSLRDMGLEFHEIILVYVDSKTQLSRLKARDKISKEEAKIRIDSQMDIDDKIKYADYLVDNSGGREELNIEVKKLIDKIK